MVVPLKTLRRVVAVMLFMLNTVVRYTNKFEMVPTAPNFSNVSFPNDNSIEIYFTNLPNSVMI